MPCIYDRWPNLPAPVIWSREYTLWRWKKIRRRSDLATEIYAIAFGLTAAGALYYIAWGLRVLFTGGKG